MAIHTRIQLMPAAMLIAAAVLTPDFRAHAQPLANPSTDELVEQLKAPRTRSLNQKRNLVISKDGEPQAAASAAPTSGSAAATPTAPATPNASAAASASATTPVTAEPRASVSLSIQFDFNSAVLLPEGASTLKRLAAAMQSEALRADRFLIEGHTDAKGAKEFNQRLSKNRAESVRRYLIEQGVSDKRLVAEGKGFSDLANKTDPLSAENRRVKVVNLE